MKNKSIWLDVKNKALKQVKKDLVCDALIIGGGITGLSILYQLRKNNVNALLVERNKCGEGITARSTAKITYLQEKQYMNIRKFGSVVKAQTYLQSQIKAIKILKQIIQNENISCDLIKANSYLFTNDIKNKNKLIDEYNFLKASGVKAEFLTASSKFKWAIKVSDTYMFHPVKYVLGLKQILKDYIYENSRLESYQKENGFYKCLVNGHTILAKYLIIATYYPYFIAPLYLPFKSHCETSYIGALKINGFENINAINIDKETISFRYHAIENDNYLIYLCNSLNTSNIKNIEDNFNNLRKKYNFQYIWSNKDIITNDYLPLIGKINKNDDTLLIACGYNTWGMTNGTLAGVIIKDLILKKENQYIDLFRPDRALNLNKVIRFFPDAYSSLKAILKSNARNCNNVNVIYTKINGKDVAIYKDENGKDHIVFNRCSHMKCGIVFNKVEKTWDCLCHGSRYDIDGKCINGPSNYDISFDLEVKK